MEVVFLDANVLFSAAYLANAGLARLWSLEGIQLVTSAYALEEARANLDDLAQRKCLDRLCASVRIIGEAQDRPLPADVRLPQQDRPILAAAIAAGTSHLVTGDATDFGPYYGLRIEGVLISGRRRV